MATYAQVLSYILLSWLLSLSSVAAEDICSYMTYDYNDYDARYERMVSFKNCQWGCCWKYTNPCCSPPVGLIVGCVIGGFLLLLIILGSICCCCCCCRRENAARARAGMVVRYPHQTGPGGVSIMSSVASSSVLRDSESTISTSLPPGVYQPPPSYEEVIAGEINAGYKPDTYTTPQ